MCAGSLSVALRLGRRIVEAATRGGCTLRILGGVAVVQRCSGVYRQAPELARAPRDLDVAGLSRERNRLESLFVEIGLRPNREFNLLAGGERLSFAWDCEGEAVRIDVILDRLAMCHGLPLAARLSRHDLTLSATDLLLSKLQIQFPTESDAKDMLAMLMAFDYGPSAVEKDYIETDYVCRLCGSDWGWYRTVVENLQRVSGWIGMVERAELQNVVDCRSRMLRSALESCGKTLRWRLRGMIGERVRWYDIPEGWPVV